jgi:iron complex transport system ATP-binding protein
MNARSQIDFLSELTGLPMPAAPGLETFGVSVAVAGATLLHPASAHFAAGQLTAIVGPNGAGKSTLMSVLTGQRQPVHGQVDLNGKALQHWAREDLARLRAFVAQETQVAFDFSVREVVELGRYSHRRQPSRQESSITRLAMQATRVDHLADRPVNTLSGGEKARVHLARALAQVWEAPDDDQPRWLLLDEPTAALDLQHQHHMLQLVRDWALKQGIGVVAVLHDLNLALRYSDRCLVLQQGRLVASGTTAEVLSPACISSIWKMAAWPVCLPSTTATSVANDGIEASLQYVFAPLG